MIQYKHLIVEHYKSIEYGYIAFTPGIYNVVGRNIDGAYSSNGASKSSILQALTLPLYNKDFQGAPIETVSNRYTGTPFKVTLVMEVDREGYNATYEVVNDRQTKKIAIKRDGKLISDSTAKSLTILLDIIGMSFETFKFTHYITTSSILELTKNLSSATLFNEVLQVTQLKSMGDDFQTIKKTLGVSRDALTKEFYELNAIHKLLGITDKYDVVSLRDELDGLTSELNNYLRLFSTNITPLENTISTHKESLRDISNELEDKQRSKEDGVCSLCHTILTNPETLSVLTESISDLTEDKQTLEDSLEQTTAKLYALKVAYEIETATLKNKLSIIETDLMMGEQLQAVHKGTLEDSGYTPERFKTVNKELNKLKHTIEQIDKIRDSIKSGKIFEEIMEDFFMLVNINIQKYRKVISFDSFEVEATSYRSGMVVLIRQDGEELPIESLSNGEKARLSLLVLTAVLESVSQTTQSNSNFLSIDEATSGLDTAGIQELAALFRHLKELQQSVFVITHGSELSEVGFDGTLIMTKANNRATSEFTYGED